MTENLSTVKSLFKRYRRPGDIVFGVAFLLFSVFLLSQLGSQTTWKSGGKLFAQAPFWPTVSVYAMVVFSLLHVISSLCSPRIPGRWTEVAFWFRAFEYAAWFMAYVFSVPVIGYLTATILISGFLAVRVGYRNPRTIALAVVCGVVIVLIFKTFLQVKVPGGAVYEYLPTALRSFMYQYF